MSPKVKPGMQICIPRLTLHTPLAERRGSMRQRTLTLLVAFVLAPVFALACAGGDSESADDDATTEETTMEAAGDEMEGGDAGEGEEGHAHEGEEGDAAGEEGEAGDEGDEMADTMAMPPDTSGTH